MAETNPVESTARLADTQLHFKAERIIFKLYRDCILVEQKSFPAGERKRVFLK